MATKVSYHQDGNHSAIRLDASWYQSKWGSSALVKHHLNDVPLIYMSYMTKKYYKRGVNPPVISGPTRFCPGTIVRYTVSNAPSSYTWEYSSNLTPVPDSPGYVTASIFSYGSAWISISRNGVELAKKTVHLENPLGISGPTSISSSFPSKVRYNANPGCTGHYSNYMWVLYKINNTSPAELPDTVYIRNFTDVVPTAQAGQNNTYTLQLWSEGQGSTANLLLDSMIISANGYKLRLDGIRKIGNLQLSYSNPSNNDLIINFGENEEESMNVLAAATTRQASTKTIEVILYDMYGQALRTAVSKGEAVQFDVSGLKDGMYYLHVLDGSQAEPVKRTVIIKHR
jgi:hypothetical protein